MNRASVLTKTAKGLMEASGKTSVLPRDLRNLLKEIDGKATVSEIGQKFDRLTEPKLLEALDKLVLDGFVKEFLSPSAAAYQAQIKPYADDGNDLDFTRIAPAKLHPVGGGARKSRPEDVPRSAAAAKSHEETVARVKSEAESRARMEAAAQAKALAEARAKAKAKAEALVRAQAEAEVKAKQRAEEQARNDEQARRAEEDRRRSEAEARLKREAEDLRARLEEERRAREEGERKVREDAARAAREAEERIRAELEERLRRESEERSQREAKERALLEARLEAERKSREEAERKAREEAERMAREVEERARREADERSRKEAQERAELVARLEAERKAREEAERKAREEAERMAREAEERARREAEERSRKEAQERAELDAKLEAERKGRAESERKAKEEADRMARETQERAKREKEQQALRDAESRARTQAERMAQDDAERKAREAAARETEERLRREAEERARLEAALEKERNARLEAERRAREEAEQREDQERARIEADELRTRLEAERAAREEIERKAAEDAARRETEEAERSAQEEAERRAREDEALARESENRLQRDAVEQAEDEAQAEVEAAARARREARAREKADAEARKRQEEERLEREAGERSAAAAYAAKPRSERNWARIISMNLFALLVIGIGAIHFVPLDSSEYEKAASEALGVPVRIGSVNLALLPLPQLKLNRVLIGEEPYVRIARVNATPELGSMLAERKSFRRLDLEGLTLPAAYAAAALWGRNTSQALRVERVTARGAKLELAGFLLPELDIDAALTPQGAVHNVTLSNESRKIEARLQPDGTRARIELSAPSLATLFGPEFALDDFSGKGSISAKEMTFSEFEARAYDGFVTGNARLRWGAQWSLEGEIAARQMDAAKIAGPLLGSGRAEGRGAYVMRAAAPEKLFASGRLDGSFTVQKGLVGNIDMTKVLQGADTAGGSTPFSEMSGNLSADAHRAQVRQLRLSAGLLNANGALDIDAQRRLTGRLQIELRSQARAALSISGNLNEPQFRRSN